MRCLHCGKRLSLLRKFSDGEFCSAEHRQLFQNQQNDLALARLIESQVRIERPKPKEPPKSQKQQKAGQELADQLVPEAPLRTEWFQPVRRRVVFVPPNSPIQPEPALYWPFSGLTQEQYGFGRPGKLPLTWTAQSLAPVAVARGAGVDVRAEDPALPKLSVAELPVEVPEPAGQVCLPEPEPATLSPVCLAGSPRNLPVAATWQMPRLAVPTQPPDPVEILVEEVMAPEDVIAGELPLCGVVGLVFAHLPVGLAAPVVLPVPVALEFTAGEAEQKPVRKVEIVEEDPAADLAAAGAALPLGEAVSLVWAARPAGYAPAAMHGLPVAAEYPMLESPALPVAVGQARTLALGADDRLQAVETAPAMAPAPQFRLLEAESLTETDTASTASLPRLVSAALPEAALARCNRTARIKTKAMAAAAGASILSASTRPFDPQLTPATPRQDCPAGELTLPQPVGMQPIGYGASLPATQGVHEGCPVPVASTGWSPRPPMPFFRPEIEVFEPAMQAGSEDPVISVRPAGSRLAAPEDHPPRFVEPMRQASDEPRILTYQIRLLDGRPMSGPPALPRSSRRDDSGLWHDAIATQPLLTNSRLTLDHADGSGPRDVRKPESRKRKPLLSFDAARLPGRRFWSHAPADLKWVALGLPLILAIVIYSFKGSVPKIEVGQQVAGVNKTVLGAQLGSLQRIILNRAAIKRYDDFRGGLGSWQGAAGWSKSWRYGEASFLEPGQLALYTPTLGMSDYTVQFLGQIERRSLNWVFRAKDEKNYYAMRIVITKAGPLPQANVVRYAVIGGKEQSVKSLPIPFPVRSDTLYLVRMDVSGNRFTTYIQGGIVDSFEDDRLESGGVGFYSPKGDRSFLRWVEVTHQYDYLGRLCALLAPYNVQADGRKTE